MLRRRIKPRATRPLPTRPKVSAIAAVFLVLTTACNLWSEPPFFDIVNETDQALVVVAINSSDVEVELAILESGEKYSEQGNGCFPARLVVRTTEGQLYARQPEQLCADDVWTISEPDP